MIAIGHLFGYGVGTLDLPKLLGTLLGETQFKQLTAIAAVSLIFAVGVTSYAVNERVLVSSRYVVPFTLWELINFGIGIPTLHRELPRWSQRYSRQLCIFQIAFKAYAGSNSGLGLVC